MTSVGFAVATTAHARVAPTPAANYDPAAVIDDGSVCGGEDLTVDSHDEYPRVKPRGQ